MVRNVVLSSLAGLTAAAGSALAGESMVTGMNGYTATEPILTVGETLYYTSGTLNPASAGAYTPPGIMDGIGAYELDPDTVRVFVSHELGQNVGYQYAVSNGLGGTFDLLGARISYFDIDKFSKDIKDAGMAYNLIHDAFGNVAHDTSFLANNLAGFSRFCSSAFVPAGEFQRNGNSDPVWKRGVQDNLYITGEEDGGGFNPVGGANWALDVATGELWHVPAFGRGGWENTTQIDTGTRTMVAFILSDDTSPFNAGDDAAVEAAPLYLYVGWKNLNGDFLERNGLRDGKLFVWVAANGARTPADFNGGGTINGSWVEIDNAPTGTPSEDGSTGFDEFGFPTQRTLFLRAKALGAFGFSRPEDVSTNPRNGREVVLASTGVDTFVNGVDTFGTIYLIKTDFDTMAASLTIAYDGDADPSRALRSPDNLDWADDGFIYIQEDKAEDDTLDGEPLFGPGAANPNEAGIVRLHPRNGNLKRIANIDRSVVLDASIPVQTDAVDLDAAEVGAWETSGILDVSTLFGEDGGTLFLIDVQAHGVDDQTPFNADSRINDNDLAEAGQLLFLKRN